MTAPVVARKPASAPPPADAREGAGKTAAKDIEGLARPTFKAPARTTVEIAEQKLDVAMSTLDIEDLSLLKGRAPRFVELATQSHDPLATIHALSLLRASDPAAQSLFDSVLTPAMDVPLRDLEISLRKEGGDVDAVRALRESLNKGTLVPRPVSKAPDMRSAAAFEALADKIEYFVGLRDAMPVRIPPVTHTVRKETRLEALSAEIATTLAGAATNAGIVAALSLTEPHAPDIAQKYALHDFAAEGFSKEDITHVREWLRAASHTASQQFALGVILGLAFQIASSLPGTKGAPRPVAPLNLEAYTQFFAGGAITETQALEAAHRVALLMQAESRGQVTGAFSLVHKLANQRHNIAQFADINAELIAAEHAFKTLGGDEQLLLNGELLAQTTATGAKKSSFDFAVVSKSRIVDSLEVAHANRVVSKPQVILEGVEHALKKHPFAGGEKARLQAVVIVKNPYRAWRVDSLHLKLGRDGTLTKTSANGTHVGSVNWWMDISGWLEANASKLSRVDVLDELGELVVRFEKQGGKWTHSVP